MPLITPGQALLWLKSHHEIPELDSAVFIKWAIQYSRNDNGLLKEIESICSDIARRTGKNDENAINQIICDAEGQTFQKFDINSRLYGTNEQFVPIFKTREFSINICLENRIAVLVASDEKQIRNDKTWGEILSVLDLAMKLLEMQNYSVVAIGAYENSCLCYSFWRYPVVKEVHTFCLRVVLSWGSFPHSSYRGFNYYTVGGTTHSDSDYRTMMSIIYKRVRDFHFHASEHTVSAFEAIFFGEKLEHVLTPATFSGDFGSPRVRFALYYCPVFERESDTNYAKIVENDFYWGDMSSSGSMRTMVSKPGEAPVYANTEDLVDMKGVDGYVTDRFLIEAGNRAYVPYVRQIINRQSARRVVASTSSMRGGDLDEIASELGRYTEAIKELGETEILVILKVADKLLNSDGTRKGIFAQIKNIKCRLRVLAVLAVLCSQWTVNVDLVFDTLEEARVAYEEGLRCIDVLMKMRIVHNVGCGLLVENDEECFKKQIIYSTLDVLEQVYMERRTSASAPREQQLVILNGIEKMFVNTRVGPSRLKLRWRKLIGNVKEVYEFTKANKDLPCDAFAEKYSQTFPDHMKMSARHATVCLDALKKARHMKEGRDFIITDKYSSDGKERLVVIDQNTGEVMPNTRFRTLVHAFIEYMYIDSGRNIAPSNDVFSMASIHHDAYIKTYKRIIGLTDTSMGTKELRYLYHMEFIPTVNDDEHVLELPKVRCDNKKERFGKMVAEAKWYIEHGYRVLLVFRDEAEIQKFSSNYDGFQCVTKFSAKKLTTVDDNLHVIFSHTPVSDFYTRSVVDQVAKRCSFRIYESEKDIESRKRWMDRVDKRIRTAERNHIPAMILKSYRNMYVSIRDALGYSMAGAETCQDECVIPVFASYKYFLNRIRDQTLLSMNSVVFDAWAVFLHSLEYKEKLHKASVWVKFSNFMKEGVKTLGLSGSLESKSMHRDINTYVFVEAHCTKTVCIGFPENGSSEMLMEEKNRLLGVKLNELQKMLQNLGFRTDLVWNSSGLSLSIAVPLQLFFTEQRDNFDYEMAQKIPCLMMRLDFTSDDLENHSKDVDIRISELTRVLKFRSVFQELLSLKPNFDHENIEFVFKTWLAQSRPQIYLDVVTGVIQFMKDTVGLALDETNQCNMFDNETVRSRYLSVVFRNFKMCVYYFLYITKVIDSVLNKRYTEEEIIKCNALRVLEFMGVPAETGVTKCHPYKLCDYPKFMSCHVWWTLKHEDLGDSVYRIVDGKWEDPDLQEVRVRDRVDRARHPLSWELLCEYMSKRVSRDILDKLRGYKVTKNVLKWKHRKNDLVEREKKLVENDECKIADVAKWIIKQGIPTLRSFIKIDHVLGNAVVEIVQDREGRWDSYRVTIKQQIVVGDNPIDIYYDIAISHDVGAIKEAGERQDLAYYFSPSLGKRYEPTCLLEMSSEINAMFLSLRGTYSKDDILTDLAVGEQDMNFFGENLSCHVGFLRSAKYVFEKYRKEIASKCDKYPLYIIGHSFGGSVATLLQLLIKNSPDTCHVNVVTIAFAPAPSIQRLPDRVAPTTISFIFKNDVVPVLSAVSAKLSGLGYKIGAKIFEGISAGSEGCNVKSLSGQVFRVDDADVVVIRENQVDATKMTFKNQTTKSGLKNSIKDHSSENYRMLARNIQGW